MSQVKQRETEREREREERERDRERVWRRESCHRRMSLCTDGCVMS